MFQGDAMWRRRRRRIWGGLGWKGVVGWGKGDNVIRFRGSVGFLEGTNGKRITRGTLLGYFVRANTPDSKRDCLRGSITFGVLQFLPSFGTTQIFPLPPSGVRD
ncbi:hypothetical protein M0802_002566 [Mischocyttarus mexicanus]|nr:hypothetical protein M0802_002566 [Mischocyttarus mexicanus]